MRILCGIIKRSIGAWPMQPSLTNKNIYLIQNMYDTATVQQKDNDTILKVNLKYLHLANDEAVNISEEEITKEDTLPYKSKIILQS